MRQRRKLRTENARRENFNTEPPLHNPERIALDTLIEISNEAQPHDLDQKILTPGEKDEETPTTKMDIFTQRTLPCTKSKMIEESFKKPQTRTHSAYTWISRKTISEKGFSLGLEREETNEQRTRHPSPAQHISSSTVFIRKMSSFKRTPRQDQRYITGFSFRSPRSTFLQQREQIGNISILNCTARLGQYNLKDEIKQVMSKDISTRRMESRRQKCRINLTTRLEYSSRKGNVSIFNLELQKGEPVKKTLFHC